MEDLCPTMNLNETIPRLSLSMLFFVTSPSVSAKISIILFGPLLSMYQIHMSGMCMLLSDLRTNLDCTYEVGPRNAVSVSVIPNPRVAHKALSLLVAESH